MENPKLKITSHPPQQHAMPMRVPQSNEEMSGMLGTAQLDVPRMCVLAPDGATCWALDLSQAILFRDYVNGVIELVREQSH